MPKLLSFYYQPPLRVLCTIGAFLAHSFAKIAIIPIPAKKTGVFLEKTGLGKPKEIWLWIYGITELRSIESVL